MTFEEYMRAVTGNVLYIYTIHGVGNQAPDANHSALTPDSPVVDLKRQPDGSWK